MVRGARTALAALLLLAGCAAASARANFDVFGPVEIVPGRAHEVIWNVMVECAGVEPPYPFADVRIFHADSIVYLPTPDLEIIGLAVPEQRSIYLVHEFADSPALIGHELLHLILPDEHHWGTNYRRCDPMRLE